MKDIYIIPTQHFDIIWRKSSKYYKSVRSKVIKKSLEILKEYPDYRFFLDQAEVIREFIDENPGYKEDLKSEIKNGRFQICGGGWTLSDVNMVSGESIIRNIMYGRQWFKDSFCIEINGSSFVDTFGMCGQLPQILNNVGDKYLIPGRTPGAAGKIQYGDYGCFLWEGIDGSKILSGCSAMGKLSKDGMAGFDGYGVLEGLDDEYKKFGDDKGLAFKNISKGLEDLTEVPGDVIYTEYMGEEHVPSEALPELTDKYNEKSDEYKFHISTPEEFFDKVNKRDLPVIKGEFNPIFTGCYTTRIEMKKGIRKAENILISAEALQVMADVLNLPKDSKDLSKLWAELNYVQFHDSICGCHIDESNGMLMSKLNSVIKSAEQIKDIYTEIISKNICSDKYPIIVINTLGYKRKDIAFLPEVKGISVLDMKGKEVSSFSDSRGTYFLAESDAAGISLYKSVNKNSISSQYIKSGFFETGRYYVRAEKTRLFIEDKLLKIRLDTDEIPLGNIVFTEDAGNLWVERLTDKYVTENQGETELLFIEENPLYFCAAYRGVIDKKYWNGAAPVKWGKRYFIYKEIDRIDIRVNIEWEAKNSSVFIQYPCKFVSDNGEGYYEVPFGSQKREEYEASYGNFTGGSWPSLNSADYSDYDKGLTVANDGTPSYRIRNKIIEVTLLRSGSDWEKPFFPFKPEEGSFDGGRHEFSMSVLPHKNNYFDSQAFRAGFDLNNKMTASMMKINKNSAEKISLLNISSPNIMLSSLKISEDKKGYIIRLYEFRGRKTDAEIRLNFNYKKAYEADMLEKGYIKEADFSALKFKPYEIKTIKLEK